MKEVFDISCSFDNTDELKYGTNVPFRKPFSARLLVSIWMAITFLLFVSITG